MSDIDAQASGWVSRLDRGALSRHEEHELQAWLATDVRHRGAFIRARAVWQATGRAAALRSPDNIAVERAQAHLPRREFLLPAIAAVASLSVPSYSREAERLYTSTDFTLPSLPVRGGSIMLDSYSQAVVQSATSELIRGRCCIRSDVGTALLCGDYEFLSAGSVAVSIDRGSVSGLGLSGQTVVRRRTGGQIGLLEAGDELTMLPGAVTRHAHLTRDQLLRQSAWTRGLLELDGETVAAAAGIINRYNRVQIVVHGSVRDRAVLGVFRLNEPGEFARAVKAAMNCDLVRSAGRIDLL